MMKELADLECERSKMESTKEAIECQLKSSIKRTAQIEEVAKSCINYSQIIVLNCGLP